MGSSEKQASVSETKRDEVRSREELNQRTFSTNTGVFQPSNDEEF